MFYNTQIDNIAQLSAINIDKFHFDASKSENSKRLSNELSLKESYIMLYNSWFLIDDKLYYY